ncbi:MAG: HEAT repeat domain-containing protein [Gemmatimonadota bacterium]|nr:HEAT repeat domain-containing protein [Gemmatimonadota bacterium]
MTLLQIILVFAASVVGAGVLAVASWFLYASYLTRVERRLAGRKGLYRELVAGLAQRDRALLEGELHELSTLRDFEALEALLEEQARGMTERPAWLLDAYDRLGLVDKYIRRLREARRWRERAFAAELLGRVGNAKAVAALLETAQNTRSEDGDVREIALRALARIADPRAVDRLVTALREAQPWLAPRIADILMRHGEAVVDPMIAFLQEPSRHPARAWAANILGELKAPRAFSALVGALKNLDDEVRAKAAGALGKLGDRRAVTYLLDHLLTDPAPFVRARIATALGQFAGNEVVDRLVRSLGDPAWWVRMRSVEALEQIGVAAETPLRIALDDPDPEIRIRAAVALERLGVPGRIVAQIEEGGDTSESEALLSKFGVAGARELLAELLHHHAPGVRAAVLRAIRSADRRDLAPDLITRARRDEDAGVRTLCFGTLLSLGTREAVPAALDALADSDERVRAAATDLIGTLGTDELVSVIMPRASDREPTVRAAAARALGLVRATGADADFTRLLRDPDAGVRVAAAEAVAVAGWKGALPLLIDLLGDADPPVQEAAVRALGTLGDSGHAAQLVRAYRGASPEVASAITEAVARLDRAALAGIFDLLIERDDIASRVSLAETIGRLAPPLPMHLLDALFRDRAPEVRRVTSVVLGESGEPAAARSLAAGLDDPDETVRAAAVDGLVRLRHADSGPRFLTLIRDDPSPVVRERAALAIGIGRTPGGEVELLSACHRDQAAPVRAAAVLALGAFDQESLVARVLEMADEAALRELLRSRLKEDAGYRLLGLRLREARNVELHALGSISREQMEQVLAEGMRGVLDPGQRIRVVAGLRAFQGERSRRALLSVLRGDPSPEVRAAALTAVGGMLDADELHLTASRALDDPSRVVRHAAVALFQRIDPEKGLPALLRMLKSEEDPALHQMVARQAEAAFPAFMDMVMAMDDSGQEGMHLLQVARYVNHPELPRVLGILARGDVPGIRAAVARLYAARPDLIDEQALDLVAGDPAPEVRRAAAEAWAAGSRFDRLAAMLGDPDPGVRQVIARAHLPAPDSRALDPLALDPDEMVRAALFACRVLRGEWGEPPPGLALSRAAAATAIRQCVPVDKLRESVRTEPDPARRLPVALALAVLGDASAYTATRSDPNPAIRDRVGRMLVAWPGGDAEDPPA